MPKLSYNVAIAAADTPASRSAALRSRIQQLMRRRGIRCAPGYPRARHPPSALSLGALLIWDSLRTGHVSRGIYDAAPARTH